MRLFSRDKYKTEQVFGVSKDPVLSYVERKEVDGMFLEAVKTDKQVIVYGASKQGKTSLVDKHLPYKSNVLVSLTPKFQLIDIYKSILRSLDVEIVTETSKTQASSSEGSVSGKAKISLPAIGGIETGAGGKNSSSDQAETKSAPIEVNLELPNEVAAILKKIKNQKVIILENFHYLDEEIQKQFSFDLRSFQELGVRFVILGVWREKNRLIQFNGDLLDRLAEVPVEPWHKDDFKKVVNVGSRHLNLTFSEDLIEEVFASAFDSIGVVQELLKTICLQAGIKETQDRGVQISERNFLERATAEKAQSYAARHTRALEAIAEGRKTTNNPKSDDPKDMPLYLPYYTVRAFLEFEFNDVVEGIKRSKLEQKIKGFHHRPDDVRAGDMSNLLYNFAKLQSEKSISPPIFDYDKTTQTIRVIDSTFYFFLRNSNRVEVLESIPNPINRN
jgi:hypothetical protein